MPFRMTYPPYSESELAGISEFAPPTTDGVMVDPYFMATTMACQPSNMLYSSAPFPQDPMAAYASSVADYNLVPAPVHPLAGQMPLPPFPQQHQPHSHSRSHSGDYSNPASHPSPYDPPSHPSSVWVTPALSQSPAPVHSVLASGPMGSPLPTHTPRSTKEFSLSPNMGLTSRSSRASSFTSASGPSYCSDRGLSISGLSSTSAASSIISSAPIPVVGSTPLLGSILPRYPTPHASMPPTRTSSPLSQHQHPHSHHQQQQPPMGSISSVSASSSSLHLYGTLQRNGTWTCRFPGCTSKAVFTRGCDLRKHHKRHTKSFFCRHANCPQASGGGFSSKKDLARHEAKHDPHVRCEWQSCERVFSRVDNMRDHVKRIHLKAAKHAAPAARLSI